MSSGTALVKTEQGISHATCAFGMTWDTVNDLNRSAELFAKRGANGRETSKRLNVLAGTISNLLLKS
ncbi:MAG: hypothetical protein M3154_06230 [Candidatus Eremiobacteraeota bacterium]|nr:hypothetical protein [Candidatus Eremiobacteraeota bacterium]